MPFISTVHIVKLLRWGSFEIQTNFVMTRLSQGVFDKTFCKQGFAYITIASMSEEHYLKFINVLNKISSLMIFVRTISSFEHWYNRLLS